MPAPAVERKLTTILAADVTGYSRLIGEDEEGTLARLGALRRELVDPQIAAHQGRIVKTTGDGLLGDGRGPVSGRPGQEPTPPAASSSSFQAAGAKRVRQRA
jgi:adenylate cyclase